MRAGYFRCPAESPSKANPRAVPRASAKGSLKALFSDFSRKSGEWSRNGYTRILFYMRGGASRRREGLTMK